jgi:hypothetical protein
LFWALEDVSHQSGAKRICTTVNILMSSGFRTDFDRSLERMVLGRWSNGIQQQCGAAVEDEMPAIATNPRAI